MSDLLLDEILNDFQKSESNVNFKVSDYEITKNLEENSNNFEKEKKNSNILFLIPEFKNPLEFIDYIENDYLKIINKNENFLLSNHIKYSKFNYNIIEIKNENILSNLIYSKKDEITASLSIGSELIIGDKTGNVSFYSLEMKNLEKTFIYPLKKINSNKDVYCFDVTDEKDFLIVGYKIWRNRFF